MTTKPTRGIDHVDITVPNRDTASRFFAEALNAVPLSDNIRHSQPSIEGPKAEQQLDPASGTALIIMRMMKLANGPGLLPQTE